LRNVRQHPVQDPFQGHDVTARTPTREKAAIAGEFAVFIFDGVPRIVTTDPNRKPLERYPGVAFFGITPRLFDLPD
jgi:hypothetical protein